MTSGVSVLAIGSEILDGRVQDTNSNFLANRLIEHGITLAKILTCDDEEGEIKRSIEFLANESTTLILTGGLGPTTDDLTREAVASFIGEELALRNEILNSLKALYEKRKRHFDPSNTKQALLPKSAVVIPNPLGTACGFSVEFTRKDGERCTLYSLPGVPAELKRMFDETVFPILQTRLKGETKIERRVLRVFGLAEAVVGSRVVESSPPSAITVSYRANFPEIQVVFKSSGDLGELEHAAKRAKGAIGEAYVVSDSLGISFEESVHELFLKHKLTLAAAESCTGGMLGSLVTSTAGSSAYFLGSAVTYRNDAKTKILGVPADMIKKFGAVSFETAKAMAAGARTLYGSNVAVSITGIAGPDGGTPEKPVGTFFIGIATQSYTRAYRGYFSASRTKVRQYAAFLALDLLRRTLLGFPPHHDLITE